MFIPPSKPQTQEGRILAALGLLRGPLPHAVTQWLIRYYDYLAAHLCLPFEARCPEDTGVLRPWTSSVTVVKLLAPSDHSAQDGTGLKCKALRGGEASRNAARSISKSKATIRTRNSSRTTGTGFGIGSSIRRSKSFFRAGPSSAGVCAGCRFLKLLSKQKEESMSRQKTYANIVETTFDTPLVKLNRVVPAGAATVLLNSSSSIPSAASRTASGGP